MSDSDSNSETEIPHPGDKIKELSPTGAIKLKSGAGLLRIGEYWFRVHKGRIATLEYDSPEKARDASGRIKGASRPESSQQNKNYNLHLKNGNGLKKEDGKWFQVNEQGERLTHKFEDPYDAVQAEVYMPK